MSARTVSTRRTLTAAAGALLATGALLSVSACGAGQISQTANQVAAVNGANHNYVDQKKVLSDVHVLYPVTNGQGKLAFVLSNIDPDAKNGGDRLVAITDQNGRNATISGDTSLPAGTSLYGSAPLNSDESSDVTRLKVTLPVDGSWRPGLTNELTFHLQKAGALKIAVPLDAGALPASAAGITVTGDTEVGGKGGGH
ncbi:hypothetical protein TSST111916_02840 [Tsukamurella strandjordii]|uniref:hypothetical protein n=1 Tax=Tsukamurella TaxID=2060 RepID=UPI001C7D086D|nr:hypothetical protein [Tsukamurella sp. TY48]GIZ96642.1 putative lipoprotein LpqE [Tsukamurella sp. TY48]